MENIPFKVVRGEEVSLLNKPQENGALYFATDTGKIYMDTLDKDKILMGGGSNSGIFYAEKAFTDPSDLSFSLEDLNSDELPSEDDLIINYSANIGGDAVRDGFYRVILVDKENQSVLTTQLPVGGGTGAGSGDSSGGSVVIEYVTPENGIGATLINTDYVLEYNLIAKDNSGSEIIEAGTAVWYINGSKIDGGSVRNGRNTFNIKDYLDPRKELNTVRLVVTFVAGGGTTAITGGKNWQITAINLNVDWAYNFPQFIETDTFNINFTPYGGVDMIAHLVFDDNYSNPEMVKEKIILASESLRSNGFYNIPKLSHGSHKATLWLSAEINGVEYTTEKIDHEIACIDKNSVIPVITTDFYQETASQWDTISIPYAVWASGGAATADVNIYVENELVTKDKTCETTKAQSFDYTLGLSGNTSIRIESGSAAPKEFTIDVVAIALGDTKEPEGCKLRLKASEINDNADLIALQESGVLTFSDNFDWTNGGLQMVDYNGTDVKCICIKNNSTMTINYNLFGGQVNKNNGQVFKIVFKAANCYDYEAPVLSCGTSSDATYIDFNAQQAVFKSSQTVSAAYREDTLIELETEIQQINKSYMMMWLDGIPCAVRTYDSTTDNFRQGVPKPITIGSTQCDVYVYLVKIYERQLSEIEHLDNFILDALTPQEKIDRFNRNDILSNGDISWEKLIKKNPNCHVYLYDLPEGMTENKDDKNLCNFSEYYQDTEKARYKAEGAKLYVQGTSSAAYGVAAFNIRTTFKDSGITDGEGNAAEGYQVVSDNALPAEPIDLTCAKVNVASCENANNALNAEWYNRYQPYYDAHRRKKMLENKYNPRDCMEFNFGILFMKDHNEQISFTDKNDYPKANLFAYDTPGYDPKDPYYKQYAICNYGNDKKNSNVFHDTSNKETCCCVEIKDNQLPEHWLTKEISESDVADNDYGKNRYEFRYPDGNDKASDRHKQSWIKFVNWICKLDPNPYHEINHPYGYTNRELTSEEKEVAKKYNQPYKIKGFRPSGFDESTDSAYTLANTEITQFTKTVFDHDNKDYRIAKMLWECEDHVVLDSLVYHYLYVLRHTMVDNIAKNTFWNTDDGVHWDLTKNYDNDTADGNDNSGNLIFSYGKEIWDKEGGVYIFNGTNSIWLTFIDALPEAQEALYRKLDADGAWDAAKYLQMFKEKQSAIPERCWIYDYHRKYMRPQELGLDTGTYLARLDGGKKTHQREQYEFYQEAYIRSKFGADTVLQNSAIDSRLNSLADEANVDWSGITLTTSHYIDLYPRAYIGGVTWKGERTPRNQEVTVPIGEINASPADATFYYMNGQLVTKLGGMAEARPGYISLGNAKKLRILDVGPKDTSARNDKLYSLELKNNTMLEEVYAQNSGSSSLGTFNAENTKSLKILDIHNSTFSGISLAEGGLLINARIPAVETIKVKDLVKIESCTFDDGIAESLKTLEVDNCPGIDTYKLVDDAKKLTNYKLLNIDWNVTKNNLNNGVLNNIDILDKLLETSTVVDHKVLLSGKITINLPSAFEVDEYAIWSAYHKKYPNIEIAYGKNASVTPAKKIVFLENDSKDSKPLFTVYSNGEQTIGALISADGPAGEAIGTPAKARDNMYEYYWNIAEFTPTGTEIWKKAEWICNDVEYEHNADSFLLLKPTTDMVFTPLFSQKYRQYQVEIKDKTEMIYSKTVSYGTVLEDVPIYYYRAHKDNNMRYEFFGWISAKDYLSGNSNPTFVTDFTITSDLTLYAYYKEQNILTTASRDEYFTISDRRINLNPLYKDLLKGPITLPCSPSLTTIGNFQGKHEITDVYFAPGNNSYTNISGSAFEGTSIKNIYFNNGIKTIGTSAFRECKDLINLGSLASESLTTIETTAFYQSGQVVLDLNAASNLIDLGSSSTFYQAGPGIILNELPKGVTSLCAFNFHDCENVRIEDFTHVTRMGAAGSSYPCLSGCGKNGNSLRIILPSQYLSNYADGCFSGYGTGHIDSVTFENGETVSSEELSRIGLSYSNPTTVELVY